MKNGIECDTSVFLNVNESISPSRVITSLVCKGSQTAFEGNNYSQGIYFFEKQNPLGCDSVITLLVIDPGVVEIKYNVLVCLKGMFEFRGEYYGEGEYKIEIKHDNDCDTTYYLSVVQNSGKLINLSATICKDEFYTFLGQAYKVGEYYDNNCDTTYHLTITEKVCPTIKGINETTLISPNGDGINDVLRLNEDEIIDNSEIWIFNRWGNNIYHKINYTNDWNADGYPAGIYYYVFKLGEQTIKKTLTVNK